MGQRRRHGVDWGGHVHSTPLLPEGVPEIDADPMSFSGGGVRGVGRSVRALDPAGGSASRPPLEARPVVHPTFLDLATPLVGSPTPPVFMAGTATAGGRLRYQPYLARTAAIQSR